MKTHFNEILLLFQDTEIGEDYCGEAEHNGPLVGTIAIEGGFSIQWSGLEITAMSYTVVQEHTVLFLATSKGHIKKVTGRVGCIDNHYGDNNGDDDVDGGGDDVDGGDDDVDGGDFGVVVVNGDSDDDNDDDRMLRMRALCVDG